MNHHKQGEVELLISHNMPVMLVGPAATGKTTLLQNAAKSAGRPYSFIAGTRQTTVGNILGFMSVNGTYVKSTFRVAYEEGHYFNIDEIDGMDSNCLLVFNSLENNIMAFPDGYSEPPHKEFRLMSTANPMNSHSSYTGRAKLDAASLDRFDIINIEKDAVLEQSLVDFHTFTHMELIRKCLSEINSQTHISMRDSIRFHKRKELDLLGNFIERLLENDSMALDSYNMKKDDLCNVSGVEECETLKDAWDYVTKEFGVITPAQQGIEDLAL